MLNKSKKMAIYTPYLDTFGGGERYILTIAEILSEKYEVDLLLDNNLFEIINQETIKKIEKHFSLNLEKINLVKAPIGEGSNFLKRLFFLKKYYYLLYLTDGSFFISTAGKSFLHIQSPLVGQGTSLWGFIKLKSWNLIIYNSFFTKKWAEKSWPLNSIVVHPPVDIEKFKSIKKKKYITSVGRFFGYRKIKKHEEMINAFKRITELKELEGWSLHLAGSAGEGDQDYINELKMMVKNLPIYFYPNISFSKLQKLYGESSIYWHAAGFGESDPTKMEHFGITTVEAMAAGCVPVVINLGGQAEIVNEGQSGYLWDNLEELKNKTINLINNNNLREEVSLKAVERSKEFSKEKFRIKILELFS